MSKIRILDNISKESLMEMIPCFKPIYKNYRRGETIMVYQNQAFEPEQIAVIRTGCAKLEFLSESGDLYLLERYTEGDIFGELFSLPLSNFEYIVTAEKDCTVIYLDYKHIVTPCENLCGHHSRLISNLFVMSAQKSQELSLHLSIMRQGSIRNKLIAYLQYARALSNPAMPHSSESGEKKDAEDNFFSIPMSLAELADYIAVDRSAMMREIKSMKDEGLLDSHRREFKLLM